MIKCHCEIKSVWGKFGWKKKKIADIYHKNQMESRDKNSVTIINPFDPRSNALCYITKKLLSYIYDKWLLQPCPSLRTRHIFSINFLCFQAGLIFFLLSQQTSDGIYIMDEMLGIQTHLRKRFIFSFEKTNVMQTLQGVRHKCENIHLQVQFQRGKLCR